MSALLGYTAMYSFIHAAGCLMTKCCPAGLPSYGFKIRLIKPNTMSRCLKKLTIGSTITFLCQFSCTARLLLNITRFEC